MGAQRIRDLMLKTVLLSMIHRPRNTIWTLIHEFHYPRLGPGIMWSAVWDCIEEIGGSVYLDSDVVEILWEADRVTGVVASCNGHKTTFEGTDYISTIPVVEFIQKLRLPPPGPVLEAAGGPRHRGFLTVCPIVNAPDLFPDNWIYVQDQGVKPAHIRSFKNRSADRCRPQGFGSRPDGRLWLDGVLMTIRGR